MQIPLNDAPSAPADGHVPAPAEVRVKPAQAMPADGNVPASAEVHVKPAQDMPADGHVPPPAQVHVKPAHEPSAPADGHVPAASAKPAQPASAKPGESGAEATGCGALVPQTEATAGESSQTKSTSNDEDYCGFEAKVEAMVDLLDDQARFVSKDEDNTAEPQLGDPGARESSKVHCFGPSQEDVKHAFFGRQLWTLPWRLRRTLRPLEVTKSNQDPNISIIR